MRLLGINGYSYGFRQSEEQSAKGEGRPPQRSLGVLAQEVAAAVPEAVQSSGDGELFVNYSALTPVLIEAIKEQQAMIQALSKRLEALEK